MTMNDDTEQQIGFQGGDDDEMPPEMKDHMLAAFAHKAGLGPHPGMYKGPPRRKRADRNEPTDTDMQRAAEEPIEGEAESKKMKAAHTGGSLVGLGPTEMEQTAVQQQGALQQAATTAGSAQAAQAQAAQVPRTPPAAPSGPEGVSQPYPAQRGQEGSVEAPEAPGGE
jgi:hypothetical protein